MTWWGNWGSRPHIFFSNGLIRSYCTLSNLRAPNFIWEILDVMQAEKRICGLNSPLFLLYFKDCVMITIVWFWYFLSSTETHRDISGGGPSRYLKSFILSFLFFCFSFLFFIFIFVVFLRGPLSSGAPGHCPPMPPSRYATGPSPPLTPALCYTSAAPCLTLMRRFWLVLKCGFQLQQFGPPTLKIVLRPLPK